MKTFISICLFLVFISGCKKTAVGVSDCIQSKINEFKTSQPCPTGAAVKEYSFQGKLVYVFEEGSCISDGGAGVYDNNCNYLGYLGGFAGNTKINGVVFETNAKYNQTLWHN